MACTEREIFEPVTMGHIRGPGKRRLARLLSHLSHPPPACDTAAPERPPHYRVRDQDGVYGVAVTRRLRAMGIRDKPIAAGSPWQNGFAERLIGSNPARVYRSHCRSR
jgi:hypothetical protein